MLKKIIGIGIMCIIGECKVTYIKVKDKNVRIETIINGEQNTLRNDKSRYRNRRDTTKMGREKIQKDSRVIQLQKNRDMDNKDNNKPNDKNQSNGVILEDWKREVLRLGWKVNELEIKINQLNK